MMPFLGICGACMGWHFWETCLSLLFVPSATTGVAQYCLGSSEAPGSSQAETPRGPVGSALQ